jgi:hypothetical protein
MLPFPGTMQLVQTGFPNAYVRYTYQSLARKPKPGFDDT